VMRIASNKRPGMGPQGWWVQCKSEEVSDGDLTQGNLRGHATHRLVLEPVAGDCRGGNWCHRANVCSLASGG
jgi:hypothetical protein